MNPDDFENRLARTPLAPPPAGLRSEILGAAAAAAATRSEQPGVDPIRHPAPLHPSRPSRFWPDWLDWLERFSAPATTLAAAWAVVLLLHGAGGWIETGAAGPGLLASLNDAPGSKPSLPPATVSLSAARHHRDRILELATAEDGDPVARLSPPGRLPDAADRPRSACPPSPHRTDATSEAALWT